MKKINITLRVFSFVLFCCSLTQVHHGIKGMVYDENNNPIGSAEVAVSGINHDVTSGKYRKCRRAHAFKKSRTGHNNAFHDLAVSFFLILFKLFLVEWLLPYGISILVRKQD